MHKIIKLIQGLLLKAPLGVCFFVGRALGIFFYLNPRKRKIAFKNIKSAFPDQENRKLTVILRKSFVNFGISIIESLIADRLADKVRIEGSQFVSPGGGIFIGIHSGSWELINMAFGRKYKYALLARQQKDKSLNSLLNDLRQTGDIKVCQSLKELIRCFKSGYMLGMVADQGAETDALEVEFFSHLVPTPKGAVYLAAKFNKNIYPCFSYRDSGFSHVAVISKPLKLESKSTYLILRELNEFYEDYIRKYPWEYLWSFKRFKRKTNRDVVILSDGKTGHLKQSKALLGFLQEAGYKVRSRIITVKYKNKFMRLVADVLATLSFKNLFDFSWLLRFLLETKTKQELEKTYADIVISTASSIAGVNVLFSRLLSAKSVVILRANIPLSRFDLAFIPEHDRVSADNAVLIKGALYYPKELETKVKKCCDLFALSSQKKIAFFLGGPLSSEEGFIRNLKIFLPKLKDFVNRKGYKLLVSTSRRTPQAATEYLEKELKSYSQLEALVIANRDNYDFIFDAFCNLADIVFVSSESISMVSEAASLKKVCLCLCLEPADAKRKVFFDSLKGEITLLSCPYVWDDLQPKASTIFDKNRMVIEKAVKKLL